MIDIHLRLENELYKNLKKISVTEGKSLNQICNQLLVRSLYVSNFQEEINHLTKTIKRVDQNTYINKKLLEQTYSDIGLNITDSSKSKNLQEFYKRLKREKFID